MNGGLGIAHLADIEPVGGETRQDLFTAMDLKLDRRVAVRVLEPLPTAEDRGRFSHESKVLGSLSSHPNVVTIYDTGFTDEDRPFLVMELLDGEDLASHLTANGPMPWTAAANLVLQLCAGLEQAHRSGTLHRDLRPSNIVLAGSVPKLTDFGLTGGAGPAPSDDPAEMQHRAPESFSSVWDERADLYALTSTLYELIDGKPPFWRPGEDSVAALQLRLTHEQPPGLDPELAPAALNRFIDAGLSKDPLDRPQTADEFAHELRLITEGRTTGSTPSVLHGTSAPTTTVAMAASPPAPEVALSAIPAVPIAGAPTAGEIPSFAPAAQMTMSTTVTDGPPNALAPPPVAAMPAAPAVWQAPEQEVPLQPQWAPPPTTDGTAIYSDFAGQAPMPSNGGYDANYSAGPDPYPPPNEALGAIPTEEQVSPRRSPIFMAALAMIAVGVLGLAAVLALSAFDSDEQQAAPALPDPDATVTVEAEAGDGQTEGATPTSIDGATMEDATTTIAAAEEQASTTETTVQRFQIPNLIGMSVEDASKLLTDASFEVLVVGRRAVNASPGTVTGQVPAAGSQVTLPLTVTLYIPKVSNLPEMVGRPADAVCLELQALGLVCQRQPMYNDQIAVGAVTATNPVGGSVFSEGTTVAVSVSLGPVLTVAVPDVANMTEAEAEAALTEAGFIQLVKAARESATVETGRVIGTEPAPGSLLQVDRPLTILISAGASSMVTVPELVGLPQAEAETMITALGLTVTVATMDLPEGDAKIGTVISSAPEAGTQVNPGSAVTITVGQLAPAEPENPDA